MSESIADTYIKTVDPKFATAVAELDRAVMEACPDLEVKISCKMLMYGLNGDFRHWICAVGVTKKAATLRFLFGDMIHDTRGVLRTGTSSTLRTVDFPTADDVEFELVADYVTQSVAALDEFKAQSGQRSEVS